MSNAERHVDLSEVTNVSSKIHVNRAIIQDLYRQVGEAAKWIPHNAVVELLITDDVGTRGIGTRRESDDIEETEFVYIVSPDRTEVSVWEEYRACFNIVHTPFVILLAKLNEAESLRHGEPDLQPAYWQRYLYPGLQTAELIAKDSLTKGEVPLVLNDVADDSKLIISNKNRDKSYKLEMDWDMLKNLSLKVGLRPDEIRVLGSTVLESFSFFADPFFVDAAGKVNIVLDIEEAINPNSPTMPKEAPLNHHLRHQLLKALQLSKLWLEGGHWDTVEKWYEARGSAMKFALANEEDWVGIVEFIKT